VRYFKGISRYSVWEKAFWCKKKFGGLPLGFMANYNVKSACHKLIKIKLLTELNSSYRINKNIVFNCLKTNPPA